MIDAPRSVRPGEELDLDAVGEYLASIDAGLAGPLEVSQFRSGASNLTYLVKAGGSDLVLRRPPHGRKAKTAHDMGREVRMLGALAGAYPYVPRAIAHCEDPAVMGCDFYVMERIEGIILRKNLPTGMQLSRDEVCQLCTNVIDKLIELHEVDYRAAGLGDFGKPEGYVRRQVEGWSKRFRAAHTPNAPSYERVMAWLAEKQPPEVGACVIHGDFRFDNVVLDPDDPLRVIGVLDWEMATIGDPLMDLGSSLAYWMQKGDPWLLRLMRLQPTTLAGMMNRDEVIAYYCRARGFEIESFDFYRIFGIFRLVVIMQQIYYRYHHGQTRTKRFGRFIYLIKYLEGYLNWLIKASPL
ncbi:MAG: phosphotransferase family protein [Candidatus Aminicenantes bacterium]|nr:MAG: phosphotransferase family protein [Candidatus Aminicenantes bacterium]